jgi:peptide/nickel transport system substrate-binding protein
MLAKDPKTKLFLAQRPSYSAILFNFRNTDLVFFQSARVRQALLLAINRPALINQFLDGYAVIANSPILPNTWAYDDNLLTTPFDPAQAVHLLDDAGWRLPETALPGMADYVRQKDGLQLAFTLVVPDLPMQKAIANKSLPVGRS